MASQSLAGEIHVVLTLSDRWMNPGDDARSLIRGVVHQSPVTWLSRLPPIFRDVVSRVEDVGPGEYECDSPRQVWRAGSQCDGVLNAWWHADCLLEVLAKA